MEKVIMGIIIISVFLYELRLLLKLQIKTKKGAVDYVGLVFGLTLVGIFTYFFAKTKMDYLVVPVGIAIMFLAIYKQGITEDGIVIVARGGELYKWKRIYSAEIQKADSIIVTYYSEPYNVITKAYYRLEDEARVRTILRENTRLIDITK